MRKIRKGDEVQVLCGRDKGKRGTVKQVLSGVDGKPERVVVENVNMRIRHVRPDPQRNKPGGRISFESGMHVSNVALYNPESKRPDRVRIKADDKGKKRRVFASDGREVVA